MGDVGNAYKTLVGKPEGTRPHGRPGRPWQDNVGMGLGEIGWDGVDWIHLCQDSDTCRDFVNTVMSFGFHKRGI